MDLVDWKGLRVALAFFVLALGGSASMLEGASHYRDTEEARLEASALALRESRDRFRFMDEEERLIEALTPRYRALEARGIIGSESRLDWVEALRSASRRLALPELRYALGTQEQLPAERVAHSAMFGVHRSVMELHLGLLHEEDLLRLVDLVEVEAQGLFSVSSCHIRRAGEDFVQHPAALNLRAACVLEWFTLRHTGAGP